MRSLLLLILCFSACVSAQDSLRQLDSLLALVESNEKFNGNVMIARNGEVAYRRSFGFANPATRQPLDSATTFRLASLSKQFTALGIAVLENDGKLGYDDPLAKYIPELAFYEGVTIRHLIHHYGGLPDYMGLVARKGKRKTVYDNEMVIALMADKQPKAEFAPGTNSSYSNMGYLTLASVIERVSGKSYGEFLQERIFTPLGMTRTAVNYPDNREDKDVAAGFERNPKTGELVRVDNDADYGYYLLSGVVGDGAVFSTTDDLLRYHLGMQTDKILPADKREVLVTAGKQADAPDKGYAFGQSVRQTKSLGQRISHSGSWAGALTWLERYPESGSVIVVLSNTDSGFETIRMLARQFLTGGNLAIPRQFTPIKVQAEQLTPYPGNYKLSEEMTLTIAVKGNKLTMEPTGQRAYPMTPYSNSGFYLEGTTISIAFRLDAAGKATSLLFTQDGQETECERE